MRKSLLLSLSFVALLAGCAPYAIKSLPASKGDAQNFVVLDRKVYKKLVLVSAQVRQTETGQSELVFKIRNKQNKNIWAQVKAEWLDHDGVVVDATNWAAVQFHRRMDTTVVRAAVKSPVSGYRIVIRSGDFMR